MSNSGRRQDNSQLQETRKRAAGIREMFAAIAVRYDFLNHLLSFNLDRFWRQRVVRLTTRDRKNRVLDLCTGTADLALALRGNLGPGALVVGADFAEPMLRIAREKAARVANNRPPLHLVGGDCLGLPFRDGVFDLVTVAFGVRNFADLEKGLTEMVRVTAPGGEICIMEFSQPTNPLWKSIYLFYFTKILPRIGRVLSRTSAYSYLPDSVLNFPDRRKLSDILLSHGLERIEIHSLALGATLIHRGWKTP